MPFNLILASVLAGGPVTTLQGEWHVLELLIQEPGQECCGGLAFGRYENIWRVRGTCIEATYSGRKVTKRLALLPNPVPGMGGPTVIHFTDYNGQVYSGSFEEKGGQAVLTLIGWAPVPGKPDTQGTKHLTIKLERPKPRVGPTFQPRISNEIK